MWTVLLAWTHTAWALSPDSVAALGFDDCLPALADATGPRAPEERVALARCQVLHGQEQSALATLDADCGALAPYAAIVAGEANLKAGDPEAALLHLQHAVRVGRVKEPAATRACMRARK